MKKRIQPNIFSTQKKEIKTGQGNGIYLQKKSSHVYAGLAPCPFYGQNGFCESKHKMSHLDCQQFLKFQYCQKQMNNTCPYYHRKVCRQWKLEGNCDQINCKSLHKDCEQFQSYQFCARGENCPFYHRQKNQQKQPLMNSPNQLQKTSKTPFIIKTKKSTEDTKKKKSLIVQTSSQKRQFQVNMQKIEKRLQIIEVEKKPQEEEIIEKQQQSIKEENERELIEYEPVITEEKKIQISHSRDIAVISHEREAIFHDGEEKKMNVERKQEDSDNESFSGNSDLSGINDYAHYATHLFNQDERRRRAAEQQMQEREEDRVRLQQLRIRQLQPQVHVEEDKSNSLDQQEEEEEEEEEKVDNSLGFPSRQLRLGLLEEIQSRQDYLMSQLQRFQSIQQQARLISTIVGPGNPETIRLLRSLDQLVLTFQTLSRLAQVSQNGNLSEIVIAASDFHFIDKSTWGLSEKQFEQLPINIFGITNDSADGFNAEKDNSTKTSCPICLDEYKEGDILRGLYCSHQFHEICLKEWVKKKRECPLCKTKIIIK